MYAITTIGEKVCTSRVDFNDLRKSGGISLSLFVKASTLILTLNLKIRIVSVLILTKC